MITKQKFSPSQTNKKMSKVNWKKVSNILGYVFIQFTFGILYFTFDVCTKVENGGSKTEQGHSNNFTNTDQTYVNDSKNSISDKYVSFESSSFIFSTPQSQMCANLQNGTKKFENSVFFSKLEDVQWVRTCMISVMGVVAFFVSNVFTCANCLKACKHLRLPINNHSSNSSPHPSSSTAALRCSSIIFHKILLFIGCAFVVCGTFVSAITVKKSLPLFILT